MGFSLPFNTQPEDPPSTEQDPPPEEPDAGLLTFRHPETGYTRTTKRIRMTQDERHDIESEFGADLFSRELGSMDDWLVSKGTSKKNYPAFCRNWLRRALKERAATKNGKAPQQSAASLFAAIAAEESSREGNHD